MSAPSHRVQPKSVAYQAISAGSAALLLLVVVLIRRMLGNDVYGAFSAVLSLAMIGEALMDFGIHQVTIRAIARERESAQRIFRNSLALKALPGLGMFVLLGGVGWVIWPQPDMRVLCALMLVGATLRSYLMTIRGVLLGLERFGDESVVVVADRVLLLAVVAGALVAGAGLIGLGVAFVASRVLAVAIGFWLTARQVGPPLPAFQTDLWRELQAHALPIGAFLVVLNIYNYVDTVLLDRLRDDAEAGFYSTAYRLYEGATYVPMVLASVWTPRLSHLWHADRQGHGRLVREGLAITVGLAAVASVVLWLAAPWALTVAFGTDALAAVSALRILASGLVFVYAIWILHATALSAFEQRLLLQVTVVGVIANAGLNLWLIPQYGRDGAAWATVGGEALTLVLLLLGLRPVWTGTSPGTRPAGSSGPDDAIA